MGIGKYKLRKENIMEIIKTTSSEELDVYELKNVNKLEADWFVYRYWHESYEGSGMAIWKKDGKYFYCNLGHCSCNGPTEDLSSIPYDSLDDIEKIMSNYDDKDKEVLKLIKEKYV